MVDVFEEVEEQLRSERLTSMFRKALPWIIGGTVALLVIAGGYWGWDAYNRSTADKASQLYDQGLEALAQQDEAKAFSLFDQVGRSGPAGYRTLAKMNQAGMRLQAGAVDEAVKLFDEAAKVAPDPILADFASLKSAFALLDTAPYADLEKRLMPLTGDKRPYRMQAKEAVAFLKLREGRLKEARSDFVVISQIFDATPGQRERAKQAIAVIDSGAAAGIGQAVKESLTAPPPQMMIPGLMPGGGPEGEVPVQ